MTSERYHSDIEEQVLKTLLYFDIFNYPLKAVEVFRFLRTGHTSSQAVTHCLNRLAKRNRIFRFGDVYSLHNDEGSVRRRRNGNSEAERWMTVAEEKAKFIGRFPYVRAVMASGSLSKGYMDADSDLDFFIVTAPNRLWIARTLLVLYKRIFLRNSHKYFCVNYFVDANHLEIEEKNIYTATELITLIPLYNHRHYEAVLWSNQWATDFFPNFTPIPSSADANTTPALQALCEFVLAPVSNWLDKFFMSISLKRWHRLYRTQYSKEDFDIAFKTRRYVSKNHPNFFQKRVLEQYRQKLAAFRIGVTELSANE